MRYWERCSLSVSSLLPDSYKLFSELEVFMAQEKVVSVNVDLLKERVSEKARSVFDSAKQKVTSASRKIGEKASEKKDKAITGVLDKSISVLEKARKKYK